MNSVSAQKPAGQVLGNASLVNSEEDRVAKLLREKNLDMVNRTASPVVYKETVYTKYIKRLLDLIVAIPAFLIVLPFNAIFAILTFFDVGRPIIFRQTRIGRNGKTFIMSKFRNMNEKKDKDGKLLPAKERVTRFGKIMRKFSLDELLSLWNVIKGDLSIIGPRPMPMFIVERMSNRHNSRLKVRPGLECPRVIHVDSEKMSAWNEELENAVWYVENISFKTDLMLIFKLVKMTLSIKKRSKNAEGLTYFVGYDDNGNATTVKRLQMDFPEYFEENK